MSEKRYGLIGAKLAHSHSPAIHAMLAEYPYGLYELRAEEIELFLRSEGLAGLNVTIPYKKTVMPLCDEISEQAARIGSVITLVIGVDGHIAGHNTDYAGFTAMLARAGISLAGQKVVILGSGGTSRTARCVAADRGASDIVVVSRTGEENYDNLDCHADADVLINTTPVGMYPQVDTSPISLDRFPKLAGVVDVIYNPLRTQLVQDAMQRGIPATGGLSMLVYQAARAAELFTGTRIASEIVESAVDGLRAKVENIVLIGMPGCGKSSVGRAVAALAGRRFVDTDEEIILRAGKPIPQIFAEDGEATFRALESEVLREAARQSGLVIATGGGSILDPKNRHALRQNGRVVHLRRAIDSLPVDGRPLSVNLAEMAAVRMPLYADACDVAVDNAGTIEAVAGRIWEAFQ